MTERSETEFETDIDTPPTEAPEAESDGDYEVVSEPIPMFSNRYFIGAVAAFIIFVIISFSGLKPSSEVIVKTLGVILTIGTAAWFMIKPWK